MDHQPIMQDPKSPFKRKQAFNFPDNSLMNSSVRPPTPSVISEEKYLALEKKLKKLKKSHTELTDQYEKIKNSTIIEKVNIQMELHEAKEKLQYMALENAMLISRIDYLEKEGSSEMRNYQRPLKRSMVRSITPGKRSRIQKENVSSMLNLSMDTENSGLSEKSPRMKIKTERSLQDDVSSNQIGQFRLNFNDDNSSQIRFNPNAQKQKPLIRDENQSQQYFCGNENCFKNYKELQQLRNIASNYGNEMQEIYTQLKFLFDKKSGLENIADHKQEILKICEQSTENNFFYKSKPELMMKKIQERVKEIMTSANEKTKNSQIELIREKMSSIMKHKKEMDDNGGNESYNYEAGQKEIEEMQLMQKELFQRLRRTCE